MAAAASTSCHPLLPTKQMMLSSSDNMNCALPPRPQSNFFTSGLAGGDEPSSTSSSKSSSADCANFVPQAQSQFEQQEQKLDVPHKPNRSVSANSHAFEAVDFSSQFKDFATGDDGVVADDMEQLFSSDFFSEEVAAATAAAVREASCNTAAGPSAHTVELMSPTGRKLSEGEGSSMASSLPSQRSVGHHPGHQGGVTAGTNYGSSAEVTAGSSTQSSPFNMVDTVKAPYQANSYFPTLGPQGYGGANNANANSGSNHFASVPVPSTIAVPQPAAAAAAPLPQFSYEAMTDPTAAAVAASAHFFQLHSNTFNQQPQHNHDPSLQFCHVANEVQFSNMGAAYAQPTPSAGAKHTCAKCHFPGSDIKIKNCPNGCTYHARCLDLVSLCNLKSNVNNNHVNNATEGHLGPTSLTRGVTPPTSMPLNQIDPQGMLSHCPCCYTPGAIGIEILPLDFDELDLVQRKVTEDNEAKQRSSQFSSQGVSSEVATAMGNSFKSGSKRPHDEIDKPAVVSSSTAATTTVKAGVVSSSSPSETSPPKCYDPSFPRTGRWTNEEIAFRDALVALFLSGKLPLTNGLKLNDFLHTMLKSKQSRLAKKMKNAKLSTKYFFPKSGFIDGLAGDGQLAPAAAKTYTAEEFAKLEMKFITSIQDPVERSEMIFHMKKEWRDHFAQRCHYLRIDFDGRAWLSSVDEMERRLTSEKNRIKSAKRKFLMSKAMEKDTSSSSRMPGVFVDLTDNSREEFDRIVERTVMNTSNSDNTMHMKLMNTENAQARSHGFGEHSSSASGSVPSSKKAEKDSPLSLFSASNDTNFKHAAPFLSGVASYIERNSIPFEHIDVWVPSYVEGTSSMGTGSKSQASSIRLCFGGSATMGVQIVSNESTVDGTHKKPMMKRTPLAEEDKTNFSMFGTYSEKFSFNSGCGLPGRVFQSGAPAWEQFVSEAHPSLFERRGGAVQFGIKSALGIPVESPNVGRVVLVMYSKFDRVQNTSLMERLVNDLKLLNPSPRWKLVVDVGPANGKSGHNCPSSLHQPPAIPTSPAVAASPPSSQSLDPQEEEKKKQVNNLINLLGEQIPLDMNSALGQQIHGIMSLRLVLLRPTRTPEEEALVSTILVLYESYLQANRPGQDIACMLARDFCFHLQHGVQQQMMMSFSQNMQQ